MRRRLPMLSALALGLALAVAGDALTADGQQPPIRDSVTQGRPLTPVPALAPGSTRRFEEIRRFHASEARQGVAVDATHFYAIDNRRIGKYERDTGRRVGGWEGAPDGPIIHLNSCVVVSEGLVCAHSNYPAVPMASSLEIWDPVTLEHRASRSLGIYEGSLTWGLRRDGAWWLNFAHYGGTGGVPGRGPDWSSVVRFDDDWVRQAAYVYPAAFVQRLAPYTSSGGNWGSDGLLYVTGHHQPEIYVFRVPRMGPVLEWIETIPAPIHGQAWAFDPRDPSVIWGIRRATTDVVVARESLIADR